MCFLPKELAGRSPLAAQMIAAVSCQFKIARPPSPSRLGGPTEPPAVLFSAPTASTEVRVPTAAKLGRYVTTATARKSWPN